MNMFSKAFIRMYFLVLWVDVVLFTVCNCHALPQEKRAEPIDDDSAECRAHPMTVVCETHSSFGLKSHYSLFSDKGIEKQCKNYTQNYFMSASSKKAYDPFSGQLRCEDNEAMTGVEACFTMQLLYLAPFCTALKPDFEMIHQNSTKDSKEAICPQEQAMVALKLEADPDGDISVTTTCAAIIKKT